MSTDPASLIVYRKKGELILRRIAGETLLVPIRGDVALLEKLFVLNPVAVTIWEQLDGKTNLEAVTAALSAEFGIGLEQAEADTREYIRELLREGLVEESAPPG